MRKLILFVHISLDGFAASTNRELNWVIVDDEIFDYVPELTDQADTAIYGRKTFEIMESYWTTAADQPNATKHDIEHSKWYKQVEKVVISNTLKNNENKNIKIIGNNLKAQILELKNKPGKNILMLGSPTAAHSLMEDNLIDEFRLFVNPILLGRGIPIFKNIHEKINLKFIGSKIFNSGVIELHYTKI